MVQTPLSRLFCAILLAQFTLGTSVEPSVLDACPGYDVQNPATKGASFTADLVLAGKACNVFGNDLTALDLAVTYETENRIHVKITDANSSRYEVPESVLPRPNGTFQGAPSAAAIQFNYTSSPFSFSIFRTSTKEVLFTTANHPIIFEPQYLRVKTDLPPNANIYGLGEHTDSFRLPTSDTTGWGLKRTFWSRDAFEVPTGTNLYGNHPVYFEHRTTGTHGVFLLNSNGMDIKINDTESADRSVTLEYNVIGGVLDFYFLAGSEDDPLELSRQYSEIVGTPAEVPYWSFGLHQCRFGYTSFVDVANVITNYSAADIPLETMWTDIDYMQGRRIFTVDPAYFPLDRMRDIVDYLHAHDQKYVLMTDPAVAYAPGENYGPFDRGTQMDIWMKMPNGSAELALVWPGVTHYPDWFHPSIQDYWTNEFKLFYNETDGIDIDGCWIDMNEPSNFCNLPCTDPFQQAQEMALPPPRTAPVPDPNAPIFGASPSTLSRRAVGIDLLNPPYAIENAAGDLSSKTSWTNATHANGLVEYDVHNIYGTMMSVATRNAMLARRPGLRTLVITRSTFAGAGAHVGKWLGDNFSSWGQYRLSISGILGMAGVFQIPMVGADICGYAEDTTSTLCARWAMLGGFYPFMRNHNSDTSISQEFYRWPVVAQAARNVLNIRSLPSHGLFLYYFPPSQPGWKPNYSSFVVQVPKDPSTYPIDLQFLFGSSILVSPVTEENSTSVTVYLPKDTFYDFQTLAPVVGTGANVTLNGVDFTEIPVHIVGGSILPLRVNGTMTTTELRQTDFELLYVDDGVSLEQTNGTTSVTFGYHSNTLSVNGTFGFDLGVNIAEVKILGVVRAPKKVSVTDHAGQGVGNGTFEYDAANKVVQVPIGIKFNQEFELQVQA
ncbi:hypothetical protein D9757_000858 [Collybiopsis confluens]|uniref:beta-glucosidase n=1 Tax=Collybiopsis confluens TaxID=2823264 RepID=A0A8H5I002_9AGAR|nr:hypothetical protein D9757_000858 [Collybiopsis confluens]